MKIEDLLSRLEGVKRNGAGWKALCPAHADKNASLSLGIGDDGRLLVHCHAGCTTESVVASRGLTLADLMPENGGSRCPAPTPKRPVQVFPSMESAIVALERTHGPRAALWEYHARDGEIVGAVARWNLPGGGKDIRPIAKVSGGWAHQAMPAPRPLYALLDLIDRPAEVVHDTEGEKAADALRSIGLLATTSAGGNQAARQTDWSSLAGRDVVILPDADDAGEKYAQDVADILARLNPPAKVRILRLPDLPPKGDAYDFAKAQAAASKTPLEIADEITNLAAGIQPESAGEPPAPAVEPFRAFPVDALPGPIRGFVRELAAATDNDPAAAALAVQVVLAGVIGNRVAAQVRRGWIEVAVLWGAFVARSANTKSPLLRAVRAPLVEMHKRNHQRFIEEMEVYNGERQRFENARDL